MLKLSERDISHNAHQSMHYSVISYQTTPCGAMNLKMKSAENEGCKFRRSRTSSERGILCH